MRRLLALVAVLLAGACGGTPSPATAPTGAPSPARLTDAAAAAGIVATRNRALAADDERAFMSTVDTSDARWADLQRRWFENVEKLPLSVLRLTPGEQERVQHVPANGADFQFAVDLTMQIRGFDLAPQVSQLMYDFRRQPDGSLKLINDHSWAMDTIYAITPNPWDVGPIEVRRSGPALMIFDDRTVAHATAELSRFRAAVEDVRHTVPGWGGRVVAYDIADVSLLDQLSSMSVDQTGAVTFPVYAGGGSGRRIALRFALNDTVSAAYQPILFRHELVHMALYRRDRNSPVWLREGVAEYLGYDLFDPALERASLPTQLRSVPRRALELLGDRRFYIYDAEAHYLSARAVCAYLAQRYGVRELFALTDAFRKADVASQADVDGLLRSRYGLDQQGLLAAALSAYGVT